MVFICSSCHCWLQMILKYQDIIQLFHCFANIINLKAKIKFFTISLMGYFFVMVLKDEDIFKVQNAFVVKVEDGDINYPKVSMILTVEDIAMNLNASKELGFRKH